MTRTVSRRRTVSEVQKTLYEFTGQKNTPFRVSDQSDQSSRTVDSNGHIVSMIRGLHGQGLTVCELSRTWRRPYLVRFSVGSVLVRFSKSELTDTVL